jgi:FRG domain
MPWPEQVISSWAHLSKVAAEVAKVGKGLPAYLCRGQSDATWGLRPSLVRILPQGLTQAEALAVEKRAVESFMAEAHLHLPQSWLPPPLPPAGLGDWWALMQHYSAPTRLLDWTYSLYAAAYFAVSNHWDRDAALYIVQGRRLGEAMNTRYGTQVTFRNEEFVSDHPPQRLLVWTPTRQMDRIVAQQGTFTVSLDVLADHGALVDDILAPTASGSEITYRKLIVPAGLKPEFMLHLRYMNIAAHSLFPGADGLGRSIADIIRVSHLPGQS